jgi:hypothetical protein
MGEEIATQLKTARSIIFAPTNKVTLVSGVWREVMAKADLVQ